MDYAEARMRAEIQAIPAGVYSFEDTMEDDGITGRPSTIAVDVFVQGDEIVVDFHRTDAQAQGPINAVLSVARSASYNAILHLTDPSIPKNSGAWRPIRVVAPPGRVVNCDYPAPEVGGNTETHIRIAYTVIGALSRALPERALASDGGTHSNFLFGAHDPRSDEYVVCYDFSGAGWGARAFADGNNAVNCINGNSRMSPVEVFETRFPWLVEQLRLVPDTGGPGRFRGGLALEKDMVARGADITVSAMADRHKTPPFGLFGGRPGRLGAFLVDRGARGAWRDFCADSGKRSPSKFANVVIKDGDRVRIRTPGGGGYGPVGQRDPALVDQDLAEGWITPLGAVFDYGRC
jgi:N-methylhydantoinase B/oxoprolinase/acetone carboxylase alpha subunit